MNAQSEEMVCRELVELVTSYLEGTLPAPDRERLEHHLDECPWCRDYIDQHREIAGALRHLDDGAHDERAWQGLLAALRERGGGGPA